MNKKLLKQLILISYKNGNFDNQTISKIASKLDRSQLKQYIKALKEAEKLKTVYIETPLGWDKKTVEEFKKIFADKKVDISKNSSLLVGTKVSYNDDVFEMSLKNNLEQIIDSIGSDYD